MRHSNGIPAGTFSAQRVMRNAGGFSIGINFAIDGTATQGGDVHGAYIKSPSDLEWRPLFLTSIIPTADFDPTLLAQSMTDSTGCYAIAIAPTNSAQVYHTYGGRLYSYSDTTKLSTRTAMAQLSTSSNQGDVRHWFPKLCIDDQNDAAFLYGTQGHSVFASSNRGVTVTDLGVPAGASDLTGSGRPNPHLVAIDPTSSVVSSLRQRCYYSINNPTRITGTIGNPTLTTGDSFSINGTTVTIPASPSVFTLQTAIIAAGIANITATHNASSELIILNTIGAAITLANVSGTPLAALGMTAGTTAATNGGIYESTTGPTGTYAHIANSPADAQFMKFDQTGRMWVTSQFTANVFTFTHTAGAFTKVSGITGFAVAVDPADSTHIVVSDSSSNLWQTRNNGTNWYPWSGDGSTSPAVQVMRATTCGYLDSGPTHNRGGSAGHITFNPAATNELWQSWGFAPRRCNPPATSTGKFVWVEVGKGIDMAVTTSLICPPGVGPRAGFMDLGTWPLKDMLNATNRPLGPVNPGDDWTMLPPVIVQPTNWLDYAADNPLHVVSETSNGWWSGSQNNPHSGYSNDGWATATPLPAQIPGEPRFSGANWGGCGAVGLAGQAICAWTDKQGIWWTEDGYETWNLMTSAILPGLPTPGNENGIGDWSGGFYSLKNICYDKTGRNFYLHSYGTGVASGIWKAPKPSGPWTHIYSGTFPFDVYHRRLRPVPGRAGELFFCAGVGQNTPMVKIVDNFDGTATISNVANTAYCTDIAFGKTYIGGAYPVVLTFGEVNGQYGYHVSYDYCATWIHLGYLDGWMDWPKLLCGDPDNFGIFYAGRGSSGVAQLTYNFSEYVH